MKKYNPQKIEKKWQAIWQKEGSFEAKNSSKKPKFYALVEFPYPSGDGLHVGHCRSYTALDILSRKRRMQGFNVLYPMGWDAFGLPTENYAIKMGVAPQVVTKKNTDNFRKQMKSLGLSFDWAREVNTTDEKYYRWTQWIFLQLFKHGLAEKQALKINWCPKDKIGLANEEVINGKCERCGTAVEKKDKVQWVIKITKYADRLIDDLKNVDYPQRVKDQQTNWIGRSEGAEIDFEISTSKNAVKVFTTRPDTIFGATFLVVAPEHPLLEDCKSQITNHKEVEDYIRQAKNKSDLERQEQKEKTGVELKGIKAINPATKKEIPVFVADYVLTGYGTGAIMAVPADDERDRAFAEKFNLPIITDYQKAGFEDFGKKTVQYKLRDWVFSRQHYWGEPIPMIDCKECGWVPVPEKDLPVTLPKVKKYEPTDTGESPLAVMEKWVKVKCPVCENWAQRETDTMPNWAGSNWYFLRYTDPKNAKELADKKALDYWMPVDWYNGGMEHTTLHLLYSRFVFKFLWDIGAVPREIGNEPYKKRTSHGIILAEGGVKMSKSKGNVINPDTIVKEYGADTLRIYEMFMGPFEQMIPWDSKGIVGARRFLEKIYKLVQDASVKSQNEKLQALLNKTIKKVSEDIEAMKFNTAISAMMSFVNEWSNAEVGLNKKDVQKFLTILFPFAPHLASELGCKADVWPKYEEVVEKSVEVIISVNGKVRDKMEMASGLSQKEVENMVLISPKIKPWIEGKEIKKIIFVPNKLINIVV